MRRFRSDADVQKYFAIQSELGSTPDPPRDLWEMIDQARREARKIHGRKYHRISEPDLKSLAFPQIDPQAKIHPIKLVERLKAVPDVRPPARKTYKLKRAF
jgi:hypothetical protein